MRRRTAALIISALTLGMLFVSPWSATADHCNRIFVMTGNQAVVWDPSSNFCGAAHQDMRRILPAADQAVVRVKRAAKESVPVAGTLETPSKAIEVEFQPNTDDPETATEFQ